MKQKIISYLLLLTLIFLLQARTASGQELVKNEVDEFTGASVKETSWEFFNYSMKLSSYARFRKIDNIYILDLKIMWGGGAFAMDKGDEIMFKLKNGEIVSVENTEFTSTCLGCGAIGLSGSEALGLKATFHVDEDFLNTIKNNPIEKIRIYTTDGYIEDDKIKVNRDLNLKKAISLITN